MKKTIFISVAILVIILSLAALFLFLKEKEVLDFRLYGEDRYEAHAPFFGDTKAGQTFVSPNDNLSSIGVIVVNLRKKENNNLIIFHLKNSPQDLEDLVRAERSAGDIIDDQHLVFTFPKIAEAKGKTFYFYLESPQSTKENALGVRKELVGSKYTEGNFYYKDKKEDVDVAFAVFHKDKLYKIFVQQVILDFQKILKSKLFVMSILIFALFLTFCYIFLEKIKKENLQKIFLVIVLFVFIISHLIVCFWGISKIQGHSGGDPYNYLFIGRRLIALQNPFLGDKRLPFYPLLLIPGLLLINLIDPILWERGVSVVAGGMILLIWYFLAKRLKIPPLIFILTLVLLVFNKEFFWLSFQAWPFTTYAVLLLLATLFFYSFQKPWRPLFLGAVLGMAGMTRQESYPAILLILILVFFYYRKDLNWKRFLALVVPLVIAALPLLISNITHYGNPLYSYYFKQGRLESVDSWRAFLERFGVIWGVIGGLYFNKWKHALRISFDLFFYLSFFAMLALAFKKYWLRRFAFLNLNKIISFSVLFLSIFIFFFFFHYTLNEEADVLSLVNKIFVAAFLVGLIRFCWDYKIKALPIILICLTQIAVVFWFFPYTKYMVPTLQFLVLFLSFGLFYSFLANWQLPLWGKVLNIFAVSMIIFGFLFLSFKNYPGFAYRYNKEVAYAYFVHEAAKFAKTLEGAIAYDDQYLPVQLYFPSKEILYNNGNKQDKETMWQWFKDRQPRYFMVSNIFPIYQLIADEEYGKHFQIIKGWSGYDKNDREIKVEIYEVKYE